MTEASMNAKALAERVRELSRLYQKKTGANPRFWRRAFAVANRGVGINEATLRRLLYNDQEPRVREKTRRQLTRVIGELEAMLGAPKSEAETGGDTTHRVDRRRIDGVKLKPLKLIPDSRGFLMEYLRNDDGEFFNDELPFGQVYVTTCYPGVIKAWHAHRHQYDRFGCVYGMAKLVLYDQRAESPTRGLINEFVVGDLRPMLIVIPPGVQHGFTAVGESTAVMINVPTRVYDYEEPDEQRTDPHDNAIPYDWKKIDR